MGITLPIALFFGILQGASELFPVSSLGHAVVVPPLLGIGVRESDANFLPFLVLLHIGTATALIALYWRQWGRIVAGFVRSAVTGKVRGGDDRLAWLLVVGTIPAGLVGFIFQKPLQANFGNPRLAAGLLIVNGGMLLGAEMLRRRTERRAGIAQRDPEAEARQFRSIEEMGFGHAALIGACQIVALFPGMSRSGSTMAGGLIGGLRPLPCPILPGGPPRPVRVLLRRAGSARPRPDPLAPTGRPPRCPTPATPATAPSRRC